MADECSDTIPFGHGSPWALLLDIVPGWSKIRFDRMRLALRAKFTQHEDLLELLLATGDTQLVECATVDNTVNRLWGEVDGRGKNMLGTMLVETRTELRADGTDTAMSNIAAA